MSEAPTTRTFLALPRLYWILWVGQFINRLGGFVLTFLPLFLTEALHYTDTRAGRVLSVYGLGGLFGASLGGWASDRFGRRRTLLTLLPFNVVVLLCFGVAPAGVLLALAAFAHGVSNGYGPALMASVGDVVPARDRARAFGYFYWAVNLGFTVAAVAGGALSRHGFVWLFVGDALTTLLFAGIVYGFVPETRPPLAEAVEKPRLASLPRALVDPRFAGFALAQTLTLMVFMQAFITLPLQERARGLPMRVVGLIAALNGVVIVVAQPVFLRYTKGQPAWRLLTAASSMLAVGALVAARAATVEAFALSMATTSLGEVAFSGAAPTYVAHVAPADRKGTWQGAYSLCWAFASLTAPLVGPWVRQSYGASAMWLGGAALCALAALLHATATRRAEGRAQSEGAR